MGGESWFVMELMAFSVIDSFLAFVDGSIGVDFGFDAFSSICHLSSFKHESIHLSM